MHNIYLVKIVQTKLPHYCAKPRLFSGLGDHSRKDIYMIDTPLRVNVSVLHSVPYLKWKSPLSIDPCLE